MKIELAKSCGFCFGVKRAIQLAENSPNSSTIGELIHNNEEINRLKDKFGVKTLDNINQLSDEKKVIIRTHGITKDNLDILRRRNLELIDATCPYVTKPQKIVEKMSDEGYDIVIFGDENHPEVKGVKSYAKGNVYVILNIDEISKLSLHNKVAIISQTTKKIENFKKIVAAVMEKSKETRVFNTICNATLDNQKAVEELAKKSDIMIIIGGKNSSNTKQLFIISKQFCEDSYLIENESELDEKWFRNKNLCGVSAGASTPDWIIQSIIKVLEKF